MKSTENNPNKAENMDYFKTIYLLYYYQLLPLAK